MKVYTLTLNPAYDVHAFTETFAPGHENLATILSKDAGGKGVNISRALLNAGIEHTAIIVLGKDNAGDFRADIDKTGLTCVYLEKDGRIRENLTLHCANGPETRISFAGFTVDSSIFDELRACMEIDGDTIVTFTGRNPSGISSEEALAFLMELQEKGAKIVLDSKSFSLEQILKLRPWLIKPNQEEISEYLNCDINSFDECVEKAGIFASHGIVNVMVSLGEQGAMLLHGGNCYIANAPKIDVVSTIGAGDSSIAGFIAATQQDLSPEQCLATAVSFGSAACTTNGSLPPEKAVTDALYAQITARKI